ncbi:hypothetical protein CA830_40550, partial [Burkholderia multivorans]
FVSARALSVRPRLACGARVATARAAQAGRRCEGGFGRHPRAIARCAPVARDLEFRVRGCGPCA